MTTTIRYSLSLVALVICAAAIAGQPASAQQQEVLPPPAPEGVTPPPPPPQRPLLPGERRERLRQFGAQMFNAFANGQGAPGGPIAPGVFGPGPGMAQPLDINKVNDSIAALLQPLLAGEASIESFDLRLDPAQTNLAADRVAATANVALRPFGLVDESQPGAFWILISVATLNAPGGARATADANLAVQTAVVPLADFALQRFKAKQVAIADPPMGANDFFQTYLREKLARTPNLTSFEDVVDLFQYICALRFVAQNDNIDRLKEGLAAATDPAVRNALTAELAESRRQRESMSNVRSQIGRDASGNIQSVDLPLVNLQLSPALFLERVDLHVTPTEITAKGRVDIVRGVEVYGLVKPIVIMTLQQLQQRDPATVARQRAFVQGLLLSAKPFLFNGEF